ncbi:cytochrome P450 [Gymnopilus junonius]|uniref:Cytochrome P450 n=1 Tax=Gymnopilus junonius TaxID=109634 RepID=A0A9P5TTJ6_GYMJU|nr:cytochrome P450 [Gymnopilus junonius]
MQRPPLGPIFSLNLAGHPTIVLNTFKAAGDLLDRRSNIYSDRPRYVMAGEILSGGIGIAFAHYGSTFRKLRRASHEGFSTRAVEKYCSIQAREAAFATAQMLKTPKTWQNHIQGLSASVVLSAVYGWPPLTEKDDPWVKKIHALSPRLSEAMVPWAFIVDVIPPLKHLPLWMAKWKREGLEWHQQMSETLEGFNKGVEEKMSMEQSPQCFVAELIENKDRHELTDKEAAWLSGFLFLAGAETTAQTLFYFIQAMLLYPEVMHKAQEELDDVVGRGRVPTFEDQKDLPYIEALVKETLRWRTPAPISLPRSVTEDDWYEGYLISKGLSIITSIILLLRNALIKERRLSQMAMHRYVVPTANMAFLKIKPRLDRDRELFDDFEDFRPDRFLDGTPDDTHSMGHASFGFGRRVCVGQHFANQMMFITIATVLWAMNIDKACDSDGNPIKPNRNAFVVAGTTLLVT